MVICYCDFFFGQLVKVFHSEFCQQKCVFLFACRATHVPVGDDQLQHLELARDIARSFNSTYGETFPEPKPVLGLSHIVFETCALTIIVFVVALGNMWYPIQID